MGGIMIFAVVVGVACIPWTYGIINSGLPLWASFIGSALFFASGGEKQGMFKTVPTILLGVLCAVGASFGAGLIPGPGMVPISIAVGLAAFLIVALSKLSIFEFVPSSFAGFATTFAVMTAFPKIGVVQQSVNTVLAMLSGVIISYMIQLINGRVSAWFIKEPVREES